MKFASIAVLLGCSALVWKFAVQPNLFHVQPAKPAAAVCAPPEVAVQPKPGIIKLLKSETLALIHAAAAKHKVPPAFVASIVAAESNFDCAAVSPKGAIGLMQLMPGTAKEYGADPAIPAQNIDAGTRYLKVLMKKYGTRKNALKRVIAAYNAGPGMVDRYRGIPPFRETRQYVTRVLAFMKQYGGTKVARG